MRRNWRQEVSNEDTMGMRRVTTGEEKHTTGKQINQTWKQVRYREER